MFSQKKYIYMYAVWGVLFFLLLGGVLRIAKIRNSPEPHGENNLTMLAGFSWENGSALDGNLVRLACKETNADHFLDRNGDLRVTDLPRYGDLLMTILDQQGRTIGTAPLSFSEGSVIDASTDEAGTSHITLRDDTEVIALSFSLSENGFVQCSLWLT